MARQRWLEEVKVDVRYSSTRLPHYMAVCQQIVGLTDEDRWMVSFPVHGRDPQLKYMEDVMRADGLERQFMDICAHLALFRVRH